MSIVKFKNAAELNKAGLMVDPATNEAASDAGGDDQGGQPKMCQVEEVARRCSSGGCRHRQGLD